MCRRKLVYLVSLVLVLGLAVGVAEATFNTVGVYDPNDAPYHNQVDQSGTYSSHTGNAGPENVIDLATFQELIGPAFDADAGGVVNLEATHGSVDGQDVIASFGVSRTKSVTFTDTTGNLGWGDGEGSGERQPTSGDGRFYKQDSPPDWVFDISPITGGMPGEVVTYVAGTVLYRNIRELYPQVIATFSGGTVTATADMPMGAPGHSLDTFFGFVAPPGEGIVNVNFDMASWTYLDDLAFITSAFTLFPGKASNPNPANEATDVPRDVVLGWRPGEYAPPVNGHTVYLSESFNDVNDGIGGITQDANSYTPPQLLGFGTTYYWRVDEVSGPPDFTVYKGDVWQFTTELFSYPIQNITATASSQFNENQGPEKTIDGSGLDANDLHSTDETGIWLSNMAGPQPSRIQYEFDRGYKLHQMWVWNFNQFIEPVVGVGFKEVTIEYSTNGTDWSVLADVPEFAQAPGQNGYAHNTTIDFGGAAAKYVKLTANSNFGGILPQYGLSEVRFFHIPVVAREPDPAYGAIDMDVDNVTLSWRAGREAASHNVYFSTDEQAVIDETVSAVSIPADRSYASYDTGPLDLGQSYYWKVNEVNEAKTPTTWESNFWSFTTTDHLVVDDFEDYNDYEPDEIWRTWVDGYENPANGSTVGYLNPNFLAGEHYVETAIVHGGEQSMPLSYNNTGGAAYSEAERTFAAAQNWTQAGAAILVLYFHGAEGNTGQLYVKVNGSKVVYDGDAADIAKPRWKQWNIDLASLGAGLQNVTKLAIGIDGNGASGTLYVDDIRLYRLAPEPEAP